MCHLNIEPIRKCIRRIEEMPRHTRKHRTNDRKGRNGQGIPHKRKTKAITPMLSIGWQLEAAVHEVLNVMWQEGIFRRVVRTKRMDADDITGTDFKLLIYHPATNAEVEIKLGVTSRWISWVADEKRYPNSIQMYFNWGVGTAPDRIRERIQERVERYLADLPVEYDPEPIIAMIAIQPSDQLVANMIANLPQPVGCGS